MSSPDMNKSQPPEHLDVIIVGASISGIGVAHYLKAQCPGRSFLILDAMEDFGGTWRQHIYPGARSDSDMYTYGYEFKPWTGNPVASRGAILEYLGEVIREEQIDQRIRYRQRVLTASWSSERQHWQLSVRDESTGTVRTLTCNFLWMCSGYYDLAEGYTPEWEGMADYQGQIVHPQTWPSDLVYKNKNVLVIGSGAAAATIVPNMADDCAHITMLQRSPTYFLTRPNRNELADTLRSLDIPDEWIHEIVRRAILKEGRERFIQFESAPDAMKERLIGNVQAQLGNVCDIRHFTPSYQPGQQRIAYLPDGDLLQAIRNGKASVVTDHIDRFTKDGVLTMSGQFLKADIVVTATGFNLNRFGNVAFDLDGEDLDFARACTYRGFMTEGVPNMFYMRGYFRSSWTMRVDLVAKTFCRLLAYLDQINSNVVTPRLREHDQDMTTIPGMRVGPSTPGYIKRAAQLMPLHGDRQPWIFTGDYFQDKAVLPFIDFAEEEALSCERAAPAQPRAAGMR